MRYPVGNTGSREEFEKFWYDAQGFGVPTSYGFHDGVDYNLRTGGDTDLNQELKAIAKGRIVYYHFNAHPSNGFGRHLVLEIKGDWGTRWVHYAHCTDKDFIARVEEVNEGQIIARLGKSGTQWAHLHFAIFKVDPATIGGIDRIAKTKDDLNKYWEDPTAFINKWINHKPTPPTPSPDIRLKLLDEAGITDEGKTRLAIDRYNKWGVMENDLKNANNEISKLRSDLVSQKDRIRSAVNQAIDQTN